MKSFDQQSMNMCTLKSSIIFLILSIENWFYCLLTLRKWDGSFSAGEAFKINGISSEQLLYN